MGESVIGGTGGLTSGGAAELLPTGVHWQQPDGAANQGVPSNYQIQAGPVYYERPWTPVGDMRITDVYLGINVGAADADLRLGLVHLGEDQQPDILVADLGLIDATAVAFKSIANLELDVFFGKWYSWVFATDVTISLRGHNFMGIGWGHSDGGAIIQTVSTGTQSAEHTNGFSDPPPAHFNYAGSQSGSPRGAIWTKFTKIP